MSLKCHNTIVVPKNDIALKNYHNLLRKSSISIPILTLESQFTLIILCFFIVLFFIYEKRWWTFLTSTCYVVVFLTFILLKIIYFYMTSRIRTMPTMQDA
jgi:hypothetical protein